MALRKARVLLKTGARLTVMSRDYSPAFLKFAKRSRLKLRYGSAVPKTLNGVWLAIAATSDETFNHRIFEQCQRAGVWVNVVDDPPHCTFIAPSIVKRGDLQIAISTGGASPLLAKMLRKKLEAEFGREYGSLVRSLKRDRERAKRLIRIPSERRNHFRKLVASQLSKISAGRRKLKKILV